MATSVYSLWLEPPPALASTSAGFIARYAGASGGRCPTFDPHVTLAGGFVGTEAQAREKSAAIVASLASAFGPLRCDAMEVSAGTRFHQCVYLCVVPTEQLANAHALAARAFGLEPGNGGGAPYMPHLSLVYGDLTETERECARKDAAAALLGDGDTNASHAASFAAAEVSLWRTDVQDRSCESWSRVDRYPLRAAASE
jgi:hypothetical protein